MRTAHVRTGRVGVSAGLGTFLAADEEVRSPPSARGRDGQPNRSNLAREWGAHPAEPRRSGAAGVTGERELAPDGLALAQRAGAPAGGDGGGQLQAAAVVVGRGGTELAGDRGGAVVDLDQQVAAAAAQAQLDRWAPVQDRVGDELAAQ